MGIMRQLHRVLWAVSLETGWEGGSAVTSAPVIPASLKLAKTNTQLELSLAFC